MSEWHKKLNTSTSSSHFLHLSPSSLSPPSPWFLALPTIYRWLRYIPSTPLDEERPESVGEIGQAPGSETASEDAAEESYHQPRDLCTVPYQAEEEANVPLFYIDKEKAIE